MVNLPQYFPKLPFLKFKSTLSSRFLIVLSSACESQPCLNGGYCSSASDPSQYKCGCSAWFKGKNCEGKDCHLHNFINRN